MASPSSPGMSRCLLEPSESLRLCFRSNLPVRWTLGQPVAIIVALENEAGVRVGHPHSRHVWNDPESAAVCEGLAAGIPLRVALEGEGANLFLLDVAGATSAGSEEGGAGARHGNVLVLNLSTGTAKGSVTILPSCRRLRGSFSGGQGGNATTGPTAEDTPPCCQAAAAAAAATDGVEEEEEEENREISLLITLMPAWSARFNRPVLPLGSLPASIVRSPGPRCPPHPAPPPPPAPPPGRVSTPSLGKKENGHKRRLPSPAGNHHQVSARAADVPVWAVRDGACNVRRLRFLTCINGVAGGRECAQHTNERRGFPAADTSTGTVRAASAMVDFPVVGDENDGTTAEVLPTRYVRSCAAPLKRPPLPEATAAAATTAAATVAATAAAAATSAVTAAKTSFRCCGNDSISTRDGSNASDVIEISAVESVSLGGFFGTVWDCSLALGAFLASLGPGAMRGKKIVELGAGCGAVSALCAALGASEVVATDARDLIPLLTLNLRRNCCAGAVNVQVQEYDWGSPVRGLPSLARGNFDVILCSDLLYDPAGWGPLTESLRQLTGGDGSVVYLAHRTRNVQERDFFSAIERGAETADGGGGGRGFRCRKLLLEGGGEGGARLRGQGQGKGQGQGSSSASCSEGVLWGRGYFPDVVLYELSPIRAIRA